MPFSEKPGWKGQGKIGEFDEVWRVASLLGICFSSGCKLCLLLKLQHFYKTEFQCAKWYVRYVYKLYDLHVMAENHIEAGFTLKLHADLLSWTDELLPEHSDSRYPEQYKWQRKEAIYHKIIAEFNKGKVVIFIYKF